jgi:hypothetical protein
MRMVALLIALAFALTSMSPVMAQSKPDPAAKSDKAATTTKKEPLDINSASEDQLKALPGIGDASPRRSWTAGRTSGRMNWSKRRSCRRARTTRSRGRSSRNRSRRLLAGPTASIGRPNLEILLRHSSSPSVAFPPSHESRALSGRQNAELPQKVRVIEVHPCVAYLRVLQFHQRAAVVSRGLSGGWDVPQRTAVGSFRPPADHDVAVTGS